MTVRFTPSVRAWFDRLETILYEKGYFGFEETSIKYTRDLMVNIRTRLPIMPYRRAPRRFDRYGKGMLFATFRVNRTTAWYVFFTLQENADGNTVFIVRRIANNHITAKHL